MQLRTRQPQQLKALLENDDSDLEEEEPSSALDSEALDDDEYQQEPSGKPSKPPSKRTNGKRGARSQQFKPELISLLLETFQRKDLLDTKTLRSLRATNKSFKDLVDRESPLNSVIVTSRSDMLGLLKCPNLVQRMASFTVTTNDPFQVCDAIKLLLLNPQQVAKISVSYAGGAGDVLAHCEFPQLTCLELGGISKHSKTFEMLGSEHAWPLQELKLATNGAEVSTQLVAGAIAKFPQLTKLSLKDMDYKGAATSDTFGDTTFDQLEDFTLENSYQCDPGKIKILEIFPLPALKRLSLRTEASFVPRMVQAPWFNQSVYLRLGLNARSISSSLQMAVSVLGTFSNATLETLVLDSWDDVSSFCGILNLKSLINLKLIIRCYELDLSALFEMLAKATLPTLTTLEIDFKTRSRSASRLGIIALEAFMNNVPMLTRVKLCGIQFQPAAANAIATVLLPRLAECCLESVAGETDWGNGKVADLIGDLIKIAIKEEVSWSGLKKLTLLDDRRFIVRQDLFKAIFLAIPALAPNLEVLDVSQWYLITEIDFNEAIKPVEEHEWGVREVTFRKVRKAQKTALKQIWPSAKIKG